MRIPWPKDIVSRCVTIFILVSVASASPFAVEDPESAHITSSTEAQFNSSSNANILSPRGEDRLLFQTFAAVGDSYASGLGAGQVLDRGCRRYDQSYPYIINMDPRLGHQGEFGRRFQPLACAGATIYDILNKQVPQLTVPYDVITVTAGGNDVGFSKIVDRCIFGIGRGSCERAIAIGERYIEGFLPQTLDRLLFLLRTRLTPKKGRIYITGYAKFFNAESTQCNAVSISVLGRRKPLDQYNRQKYNDLIDIVNMKIREAAKRAGPHVTFVDYDPYFSQCEGRLCEHGVIEPDLNRARLLFFERGSNDAYILHRDSRIVRLVKRRFSQIASFFHLPDTNLRVFHPRSNGQKIIADAILAYMQQDMARDMGTETTLLQDISCPL